MVAQAVALGRDKDLVIEELRDEIAYLQSQLVDQEVQFPDFWQLAPNEKRVLRHLLKRRFATHESIMAVLYHRRGGEEPGQEIVKVYIHNIRQVLNPLGIAIRTAHGEGYYLPPDMASLAYSYCDRLPGREGGAS